MTYILAEIAMAHMGDIGRCQELIYRAKESGADGVKIQMWELDEIKDHPRIENMKRFYFADEQLSGLKCDIDLWGSAYGVKSYKRAKRLCDEILVCKAERGLIEHIANAEDKAWFKSGIATVQNGRRAGVKGTIFGKQHYPTKLEDADIPSPYEIFEGKLGYADHTSAASIYRFVVPVMAMAKGSELIEKHICMNRRELKHQSNDWVSALEPEEFIRFVHFLRECEKV